MQLRQVAAAAAVLLSLSLLLLPSTTHAHNITRILDKYPEFSTFNHYLTVTQLAPEINRRETITVCAVDNAGMSDLLSKHLNIGAIKNVLSLHVLLDYFDSKKLHQITDGTALAATMFQATGSAPGSAGFVNITDLKGRKISSILPSPEAEAPAPGPSQTNITALMSAHGCKVFAETLLANPAEQTFEDNVESERIKLFSARDDGEDFIYSLSQNSLTTGSTTDGIPVYQSLAGLKSSNGLTNTLATTAPPLAIYELNKVLMPKEVFKAALSPTPAPAPAPEADAESPKASKKKHKSPPAPAAPSDSPADAPDGDVADQTTDKNGAVRFEGGRFVGVILSLWFVFLQL
ncbi:UNVERIFIED_CONTAM: Fasciclin-like arabinogalactan protein 1 [Sesamum calycinum]|uniref:Fasciclin-like arabinogalactan protein 1 n=1 Tax=Sesamum calycinum TaxID=2727403 RepID=A0AAW2Q5V8_9LAMI